MKIKFLNLLFFATYFFSACGGGSNSSDSVIDTPTTGAVNVGCDETLKPIAEAELAVFSHTYPQAHITMKYKSEVQTLLDLQRDSVDAILLGRQLDSNELNYFRSRQFMPQSNLICRDAIAFVVHPSNRDTNITYEKILQILRGSISNWAQVGGGTSGNIQLVFDQPNSGTVSYILKKIASKSLPSNAFAAQSNTEAINYVASNPSAIGIVGWSWLSDTDDRTTKEYLKKIKVVGLSMPDKSGGTQKAVFAKPFAENIVNRFYPFYRDVYVIVRERRAGLASGFSAFMYNEIGQRILSKAGLLPRYEPEHNIEIKKIPKIKFEQ